MAVSCGLGALLLVSLCLMGHNGHVRAISIADTGAIEGSATPSACLANVAALQKAISLANASATDREVLVPAGGNYTIYNSSASNIFNVTFRVDGNLIIQDNITDPYWAKTCGTHNGDFAALHFFSCDGLTFTGEGVFDGQGYNWWWDVLLGGFDVRPDLFIIQDSENIVFENFKMVNSPQFHIKCQDCQHFRATNVSIIVDVVKQKEYLQHHGFWHEELNIPTFPLNTDGIDPSGNDVLIEDSYIQNFDDAVAVKPTHAGAKYGDCSENMVIRNSKVAFGVGLTIGSVPPHEGVNCVRNITFENIELETPIKTVYIKSNPGTKGTGLVEGITYRNIVAHSPLWYPIWIGPQQQQQPGKTGTGCNFLFPILKECPTQPLVTIRDISMENVTFTGGLTLPGVLLANVSNPYTNITFNSVNNTGPFLVGKDYVCENAHVETVGSVIPMPSCAPTSL